MSPSLLLVLYLIGAFVSLLRLCLHLLSFFVYLLPFLLLLLLLFICLVGHIPRNSGLAAVLTEMRLPAQSIRARHRFPWSKLSVYLGSSGDLRVHLGT